MLSLADVTVARGGLPVLEGVSFDVGAGQALVLRGPNGIGKTTLLRAIAGLQPVLAGTIAHDEDAVAYGAHSDGLKAQLSVRENLQFWADVYGGGDVEQALHDMNMADLQSRPAAQLSAGQKRRLGLARLLVTGRPIWVLDEPTVSLDKFSVNLFADRVRTHLASGGAAVLATHIDLGLSEARELDLAPFKAVPPTEEAFDEAFL
ncbi:heme ABC exporter ATP-binding protein CcmA [Nereida sp. MMG025]|uniref:heme ABC exporter ATP-binding protein CcmA n=1 Tax=Nereida sp. MMG025 TaxID=2909981 RepID=UPI001F01829B|nr:heme ABC exporter ATP-binding protein CcmA [Nereida sp. MMG025]MCF6445429.1 heme ABC exporter ATP-binding protein CcmA [Nereida sp. MMG025]